MTKRRFILLALLIGVFAFLAAGCGGGDDSSASGQERGREAGGAPKRVRTATVPSAASRSPMTSI